MGGRGFRSTLLKKVLLQDAPRTLPRSLAIFAFAAIWIALQAIPIVGMFLFFLLAPLWSIVLINAGFLGIGAEAIAGRVPRVWLVLPIAWFGGYLLFAWHDHRALDELRAEIATGNAATHIPFDPSTEA